jgi:hypothetical protein
MIAPYSVNDEMQKKPQVEAVSKGIPFAAEENKILAAVFPSFEGNGNGL